MNLKEVYEIFYPGKCKENPSVWNVPPKYRSKKDFFEELLPMEIRWINCKIWNDKARRSRFFSDCKGETRYIASLRTFLFEQPWTISRIEGKANDLLSGQISEKVMNESFLRSEEIIKEFIDDYGEDYIEHATKKNPVAVMGNGDVTGYVYIVKTHAL